MKEVRVRNMFRDKDGDASNEWNKEGGKLTRAKIERVPPAAMVCSINLVSVA